MADLTIAVNLVVLAVLVRELVGQRRITRRLRRAAHRAQFELIRHKVAADEAEASARQCEQAASDLADRSGNRLRRNHLCRLREPSAN